MEYEVILGDSKLIRARKDNEYADLWHALPWCSSPELGMELNVVYRSHGSIGLLVGLTLEVCEAKPWVELTYEAVQGKANICSRIREVHASVARRASE